MSADRVLQRIRWTNVGKLVALVGLATLVVAWPRLERARIQVPDGAVRPVAPLAAPSHRRSGVVRPQGAAKPRTERSVGQRPDPVTTHRGARRAPPKRPRRAPAPLPRRRRTAPATHRVVTVGGPAAEFGAP